MFENLSLNTRMWAAALATAVVISGIGLAVALNSSSGSGKKLAEATPSPALTLEPTPSATEVPSASPSSSPSASESPSPAASASSTAAPAPTGQAARDPAGIDCGAEPRFCSDAIGMMSVKDGKLQSRSDQPTGTNYAGVPVTKMTSTALKPDQTPAKQGDQIGWIKVHVDVTNNTGQTFVFPQRKVALVVTHGGKNDVNETSGPYTEVPPGGVLHADFLNPEFADGSYSWRVKVFFYAK